METVDRADERRVDAVAEHAADVIGDRSSDVARNRQREGFHRSQPRLAVLGGDGKTLTGGVVSPSAMPKGAHEEDARAGGHNDRYRAIFRVRRPLAPAMAARYD